MKKFILNISFFIFLSLPTLNLKAQIVNLTAGTVCFDSLISMFISVPISVQNMQNVYNYSMKLNYNKTVLTFAGYNIANTTLLNTSVVNNSNTGQVEMALTQGTTPINILNDTIYTINFILNSVTSVDLLWDSVYFFGQSGSYISSTTVNGAILNLPEFLQQPISQSVIECLNNSVDFSVNILDTIQAYQWQVSSDNGATWTDLINDNQYQGVLTSTLTIVTPHVQMNNYLYRCELIGPCITFSDEAKLNVFSNVLTQPRDTLINIGGTAVFKTQATGNAPSYLWEVSTNGGVTWSSSTLSPPITTSDITIIGPPASWSGYKFRCIVNGECSPPADTTQIATLWVGAAGIEEYASVVHSVFPNPATDYFNITFNKTATYNFILYDLMGRQVIQIKNVKTDLLTIHRQNLDSGLYFYRLTNTESGLEGTGKIVFN